MLVKIAKREDPDKTASSEKKQSEKGVNCLSRPFWQATCGRILEYLPYHIYPIYLENYA